MNRDRWQRKLLALYDLAPFHKHPLWEGVLKEELSLPEIFEAEKQHYFRTKHSKALRSDSLARAQAANSAIFGVLLETYLEECTDTKGTNHLSLVERLLTEGGMPKSELLKITPTPGNSAAIALYKDISSRGAACHLLGAGVVELFYADLCPKIFDKYVNFYGMTEFQAETYKIHGPMDKIHGERALSILDDAIKTHGWDLIELSVRDAFVATSLHYDGMLQAAKKNISYWDGVSS